MSTYHNIKATKQIGTNIQRLREFKELEIEDIADMTGFSSATIRNIEKGKECTLSYLIAIALALDVQPKELLEINIKIKPLFPLSVKRKEKSRLTSRINKLIDSDYFKTPRFVRDVCLYLNEVYDVKTTSDAVSVILIRLKSQKKLSAKRQGRQNIYYIHSGK